MNKKFFQLSLVVLLCLIIYIPFLQNGFIWDDDTNLYQNPWVQKADGLKTVWLSNKIYQYYPINFTAFWLEHKLWGLNPFGYHTVNLILHILNALLVFWVIRKLYARLAFAVALLFAIHPIQVETVAWITEQKNLLSLFFFLSTILTYLRFDRTRKARDYLLVIAMFICALLSKPVAVCFIFFPVLYKWWLDQKVTWREIRLLLPLVAIGLVSSLYTLYLEYYHVGAQGEIFNLTFLERFILSGRIIFFYIYKLLFPFNFVFFYPLWVVNTKIWWQWLFIPVVILTLATLFIYRKKTGGGALALFIFYIISIFPVLGFLNVYGMKFSFVADHFSYLSTPALLLLLCAGITFLFDRLNSKFPLSYSAAYRILKRCIFIFIIIYMCSESMVLAGNYKNEIRLWSNLIRNNPSSWTAYGNLGAEYVNIGRNEEGIALCKKSIELNPTIRYPYYTLGNAYDKIGRKKDAIEAYKKAIYIDPKYIEAYNNLASVYADLGEVDKAIGLWQKVVQLNPDFSTAHFNLATFYYRQGKYDLAVKHCDEVIKLGNEVDPKFLKLLEPYRK